MMTWAYNENIEIDLPELTIECYDKFIKDSYMAYFISKEGLALMREKFMIDNGFVGRNKIKLTPQGICNIFEDVYFDKHLNKNFTEEDFIEGSKKFIGLLRSEGKTIP